MSCLTALDHVAHTTRMIVLVRVHLARVGHLVRETLVSELQQSNMNNDDNVPKVPVKFTTKLSKDLAVPGTTLNLPVCLNFHCLRKI